MTIFNLNSKDLIYPYEEKTVNGLAKKWGIKNSELREAIIQTGSLKKQVIKNYLAKKGIIFSYTGMINKIKTSCSNLAGKFIDEEDN